MYLYFRIRDQGWLRDRSDKAPIGASPSQVTSACFFSNGSESCVMHSTIVLRVTQVGPPVASVDPLVAAFASLPVTR